MNTFSENIERMKARHLVGMVVALCSSVFYAPVAFAGGTGLARVGVQPPPDTTPSVRLMGFRPDGPDTRTVWYVLRNDEPLVAFSDDGAIVLSASELEGLKDVFLGQEGNSLRFALVKDGADTGIEAIVQQGADANSARVTLLDANGNTIQKGTVFGPSGAIQGGTTSNLGGGILAYYAMLVAVTMWCIGRCDRCSDTCKADNCDNNACNDCWGGICGTS